MMFSESQMDGGFTSTQFTNSPAAAVINQPLLIKFLRFCLISYLLTLLIIVYRRIETQLELCRLR